MVHSPLAQSGTQQDSSGAPPRVTVVPKAQAASHRTSLLARVQLWTAELLVDVSCQPRAVDAVAKDGLGGGGACEDWDVEQVMALVRRELPPSFGDEFDLGYMLVRGLPIGLDP